MDIIKKSPTRIDLAGGTLDLWPIYLMVSKCVTVNLSINIETKVILRPMDTQKIEVNIVNLNHEKTYNSLDELLGDNSANLNFIRPILEFYGPESGFYLETNSESPVGGGLGGSSSLMISTIRAFDEWMGFNRTLLESVALAKNLEAQILRTPTGCQDYFPPLSPGLNVINFTPEGPCLRKIPFDLEYLEKRLILVDTGKAHHSGINNWQVYKAVIEGDSQTLAALGRIRDVAQSVMSVCEEGQLEKLPELFNQEFKARVELSEGFTCEEIERLRNVVLHAGADAVKICGAGGGGCVLVWSAPELKEKVIKECEKNGFQVLKTKLLT